LKEGFTLKTFTYHHIVKVYEPFKVGRLWGLVMEYIPGQDLNGYICKVGALPEAVALGYIDQIAQALDCVHQQNFFHRDVKPHNIMLREGNKEAVLIDFGLAREFIDFQTMYLSNSMGTELYKPVEQYNLKGKFGAYTDVYALAVTLYHLLTGTPPGGGGMDSISFTSIVRKKNHERGNGEECDQELWEELATVGVSEKIVAGIKAGMAVEAKDRPQTMQKFRELLGVKCQLSCPVATINLAG
jgi:eukaryotic-like serine/threonine-protein kinase